RFQTEPGLEEVSGYRVKDGHEQFYIARPIVVKKVCLQCHDTPERAPQEVVARYGRDHGFGWKEGDRISAIMVSVPAQALRAAQAAAMWKVSGIFAVATGVLALLIYLSFEFLVNRRLRRTADVMHEVAEDPTTKNRLHESSRDEVG